jgi:hypothetical protein
VAPAAGQSGLDSVMRSVVRSRPSGRWTREPLLHVGSRSRSRFWACQIPLSPSTVSSSSFMIPGRALSTRDQLGMNGVSTGSDKNLEPASMID